jgi:hypothetical protein
MAILWLTASPVVAALPPKADFYVSSKGNDEWSGFLAEPSAAGTDGPLASISGARDAIRRLKARGKLDKPILVAISGGTYRVTEPIVFAVEDSGSKTTPITYAAYPGESVVVSSGKPITRWQKSEGPVWSANIGAANQKGWRFRQLWVNGRRATPARFPNEGYFRTAGLGASSPKDAKTGKNPEVRESIRFQNQDIKHWSNLDDAVVSVYHSWTSSLHRIKSLDTKRHLVQFTAPSSSPMGYWEKNQRYFVAYVREGLDAPGEWYLDHKLGVLSYYPRPDEDMNTAEVIAPQSLDLLRLEGNVAAGKFIGDLRFERLSFQHTDWAMPDAQMVDGQAAAFLDTAAVYARGVRDCIFQDCEIVHTGGYGLWLQNGCKDSRVVGCHFHDLGAGGVRIGEQSLPEKPASQAERNQVVNCFLHDGGKVFPAGVGVWIGRSSHNTVAHNEISDFYYTGVSVGWSWGYAPSTAHDNAIEYNHIHHLGWGELSDMGGIYCLGIAPGTRLRYNRIHDILSYSYGGWGLYTDEGSTGVLLENNVVYRVKDGAFHQHYGRENIVRNNVLALSATRGQIIRSREENHSSFTIERNIIMGNGVPMLDGGWAKGRFLLRSNCYWDSSGKTPRFPKGLTLKGWQEKGHDAGSIVADPKFADPANGDFAIASDSPALTVGFVPIDTGRIGLFGSAEWIELPNKDPLPEMKMPIGELR